MQAISATEFARNLSHMLDQVEHQGLSLSIVRNQKQVAKVIPQVRQQTAMEAFGDLYRPLEGLVHDDWMADIHRVNAALRGDLADASSTSWG